MLAAIAAVGIASVVTSWFLQEHTFLLGLLLNVGTGAVLFAALGLLTGQFEERMSELEAAQVITQQRISNLENRVGVRPSPDPLKAEVRKGVKRIWDQRHDTFLRLKRRPTTEKLGQTLNAGERLGRLYSRVRVSIPQSDFCLDFSDKYSRSMGHQLDITLEGRSEGSKLLIAEARRRTIDTVWTSPVHAPKRLIGIEWYLPRRDKITDVMVSIADSLRNLGMNTDNFEPDEILARLIATVAVAYGYRPGYSGPPGPEFSNVYEMPNDQWVVTTEGLSSVFGKQWIPLSRILDDGFIEEIRQQQPDDQAKEDLNEAVEAAKEDLSWLLN